MALPTSAAPPTRTFPTPGPISADLVLEFGSARIIAGERDTTAVVVRAADASRRADVDAAERTRIEFTAGRLEVAAPRQRHLGLFGRSGSIEIVIELPAGSAVRGRSAYGDLTALGRLGDCALKTSYGNLRVEEVGVLDLRTSGGDIVVGRATGVAEISSSWGNIRIREAAAAMNLKTASGDISVEKAVAGLHARTAYGRVRIVEAGHGLLTLTTAYGDVEVGVPVGTPAFLDATSAFGRVSIELERSDAPPSASAALTLRVRSSYGNVTIRRP